MQPLDSKPMTSRADVADLISRGTFPPFPSDDEPSDQAFLRERGAPPSPAPGPAHAADQQGQRQTRQPQLVAMGSSSRVGPNQTTRSRHVFDMASLEKMLQAPASAKGRRVGGTALLPLYMKQDDDQIYLVLGRERWGRYAGLLNFIGGSSGNKTSAAHTFLEEAEEEIFIDLRRPDLFDYLVGIRSISGGSGESILVGLHMINVTGAWFREQRRRRLEAFRQETGRAPPHCCDELYDVLPVPITQTCPLGVSSYVRHAWPEVQSLAAALRGRMEEDAAQAGAGPGAGSGNGVAENMEAEAERPVARAPGLGSQAHVFSSSSGPVPSAGGGDGGASSGPHGSQQQHGSHTAAAAGQGSGESMPRALDVLEAKLVLVPERERRRDGWVSGLA